MSLGHPFVGFCNRKVSSPYPEVPGFDYGLRYQSGVQLFLKARLLREQVAERAPPKVEVAGSSPVVHSTTHLKLKWRSTRFLPGGGCRFEAGQVHQLRADGIAVVRWLITTRISRGQDPGPLPPRRCDAIPGRHPLLRREVLWVRIPPAAPTITASPVRATSHSGGAGVERHDLPGLSRHPSTPHMVDRPTVASVLERRRFRGLGTRFDSGIYRQHGTGTGCGRDSKSCLGEFEPLTSRHQQLWRCHPGRHTPDKRAAVTP